MKHEMAPDLFAASDSSQEQLLSTPFWQIEPQPLEHVPRSLPEKTDGVVPPGRGRKTALAAALVLATSGLGASLYLFQHTGPYPSPAALLALAGTLPLAKILLMGGISGLGILGAGLLFFVGLAMYIVSSLTRPQRSDAFVPLTPFVLDLPAEEVQFPASNGKHQVSGLFIPRSGSKTTILVCPGYRRTYKDVLGMCKHLWWSGHNILVFEYYGHGSIVGVPVTLGYREIDDFLGAVAYAKKRTPEARLGALGYSMGGAISIMGSARCPEIEAIVADSSFATHWSAVEVAIHRVLRVSRTWPRFLLSLLRWITDQFLWLRAGYRFAHVEPLNDIPQLAPRPLLLIHGLKDSIVDPRDAQQLYQAAKAPKALWLLPETEHIKAYFTDSTTYVRRITDFFDRAFSRPKQDADTRGTSSPLASTVRTPSPASAKLRPRQDTPQPATPPRITAAASVTRTAPSHKPGSSLGSAYGKFVYRFRWLIAASWLLLLAGSLPLAKNLPAVLHNSGYAISSSESSQVDTQLITQLHRPATQVLAVFQSTTTSVSTPAYQSELSAFTKRAHAFPHVIDIQSGGVGKDGRSTVVAVGFDQDKDAVSERIPDFRALLPQGGPAQVRLTGDAAVASEIQLDTQADTEFAEFIAAPITLLVLLIVFGSLIAGAMPLILAGVAVPTALAAIYLIALRLPGNIFEQSIASIIGLGLSIDYSLFIIRRFREELARGATVQEAVTQTVRTAGEAILFSGLIVIIGFSGLLFIGINVMTSFAIGGIAVAAASVLGALTLLPALLSLLGQRINAFKLPFLPALPAKQTPQRHRPTSTAFWHRWALTIMQRPVLIVVLVSLLLLLFGWPARLLNPGDPGVSALPPDSQVRQGLDILHAQFTDLNDDPIYVLARTADGSSVLDARNVSRVDALSQWLLAQRHVTAVQSLSRPPQVQGAPALNPQQLGQLYSTGTFQRLPALQPFVSRMAAGDTTLLVVRTDTKAGSNEDQALIDHLRAIDPQAKQGFVTLVGGARAINQDFDRTLYSNFIRTLAFILLATFVILLVTFRSIVLPLKAILMNIISISAAYGALVYIFQQGHLQQVLHFTADGSVDRFIPILLFCILFGLSMDYEVFLLTRVREAYLQTGDNRAAVALGLEKTGGIITSAALLFVIVSSAFMVGQLVVTKELGMGITVSILVDASIIRCLLVPASMQLLGKWNWWFPAAKALPVHSHDKDASSEASLPVQIALTTSAVMSQNALLAKHKHIEQALQQLIAPILGLQPGRLHGTDNFLEHVGDSDTLTMLLEAIKHRWQISIEPREMFDCPALEHLAWLIVQRQRTPKRNLLKFSS